jgi:SAM-dependent methyltransferase
MSVNRRMWDESVPLHVASASYDVPGFLRGRDPLYATEVEDLRPMRGRALLHLQCHFGMDTLAWARRGAQVTGVDFSAPAVRAARALARAAQLDARFVRSNVYDLPRVLSGRFDLVYTAKGALCWLPDLGAWARVVARYLRPGGRFYLLEDHPIAEVYANGPTVRTFELELPYFGGRPLRDESPGTYAAPTARLTHALSYAWIHPISETIQALLDAGLTLERVREFPYSYWRRYPFLTRGDDGYWHLPAARADALPLMWSLLARKPPR